MVPEKITGKTEDRAKLNFEQLLEFVAEKFPSCVIEKQVEETNEDTGATERFALQLKKKADDKNTTANFD